MNSVGQVNGQHQENKAASNDTTSTLGRVEQLLSGMSPWPPVQTQQHLDNQEEKYRLDLLLKEAEITNLKVELAKALEKSTVTAMSGGVYRLPEEAREAGKNNPTVARELIGQIWENSFHPKDLHKLRQVRNTDSPSEHEFAVEGGRVIIKSASTSKVYGSDTSIWSQSFLKYQIIMTDLFAAKFPTLPTAMLKFHQEIISLAETYEWSSAVLPCALSHHEEVIAAGPQEADLWRMSSRFTEEFCKRDTMKTIQSLKRPAPSGPSMDSSSHHKRGGRGVETCNLFNTKGCAYGDTCKRVHRCSICSSSQHGANGCKL
jgi:hypothetical protein